MSVCSSRLTGYAESAGILPDFQFGFRKNRSTFGAAALLHEAINSRLQRGEKTYAAFIDFSKCFDSIDRSKLFIKLYKAVPVRDKEKRLYKGPFPFDSARSSDIFRLKDKYKNLSIEQYASQLKVYLHNVTATASVTMEDFSNALEALSS